MVLEKNVGGFDRIARTIIGLALVLLAGGAFLTARRGIAVPAALAGAALLFNAATKFCGLNALFGIDSCSWNQ